MNSTAISQSCDKTKTSNMSSSATPGNVVKSKRNKLPLHNENLLLTQSTESTGKQLTRFLEFAAKFFA